jgi:hypothetical protein
LFLTRDFILCQWGARSDVSGAKKESPILLYVVTKDWYFFSHRLPMALAAQQVGYQVHVATNVNKRGTGIEAFGFHLHLLSWRRGRVNPLNVIDIIRQFGGRYRSKSRSVT